jgi:hypothetical protein
VVDMMSLFAVFSLRSSSEDHGDQQNQTEDQRRQNCDGNISRPWFAGSCEP